MRAKFGIQLFYSHSYDFVRKKLRTVGKEGWDSAWLPDHLRGIPPMTIDDFLCVWPMLGSFAEMEPNLVYGVAVTEPHRLHPASLAQTATTIDHISNGKFILGIGAGEAMNLKCYGIEYSYAVSKMREHLEIYNKFWESEGKPIDYDGRFYHIKNAVLSPSPIQRSKDGKPHIPIWVAGNGPKTKQLTGELADGWIPFLLSPKLYKEDLEDIKKAMTNSNRDQKDFTAGAFCQIYMNDDEKKIKQRIIAQKMRLILVPQALKSYGYWKDEYCELYEKVGLNPERLSLLEWDSEDLKKIRIDKLFPVIKDVPDEFIRQEGLIGDAEELTKKIETLIQSGVEYFVLEILNGSSSKNAPFTYFEVSKILAEKVIPQFKD
ncbi:MAG: LLM class flavin-dependent oxidoreductase [Candidatus Helarchaeota archaeon]|nr:LLM class flavin-dependent oxidoreductase [Candidatus Helarchaeota archaeon]